MSIPSVRLKLKVCLVSLVLGLSSSGIVSAVPCTAAPAARITALKAFTVDPEGGEFTLSNDVFEGQQGSKPPFAGSGTANYPTHYLMVMVEVTDDDGRKVELTATEGRKVVWRKISPAYIQAGRSSFEPTYAVFFIEGDRCEIIKLKARLVGPGKPSSMTKAIEFVCSE